MFVNVTPDLMEFMDLGFPRLFACLLALDLLDFPDSSGIPGISGIFRDFPGFSGIYGISSRYPCIKKNILAPRGAINTRGANRIFRN